MTGIRKGAHWHPKTTKDELLDEINEWIRTVTHDPSSGLRDGNRISKRDLEAISLAIAYATDPKT